MASVGGVLKESWALRESSFPQAKLQHSTSLGVLGTLTCLPVPLLASLPQSNLALSPLRTAGTSVQSL